MAKILILRCPNCGNWDIFSDSECGECGNHVYENSDPHNDGTPTESLLLDLTKVAERELNDRGEVISVG